MPVREALWTWIVIAAVAAAAAAQPAESQPSAYDRLDKQALARKLTELKMTELLEAMIARSGEGLQSQALLIQSLRAKAKASTDQAERDALLARAAEMLDEYIKATAQKEAPADLIAHYRARLDRIIVLGIELPDPHVERLLWFIGSDRDKAEVKRLASQAVKELDVLYGRMDMLRGRWSEDWERWIDQTFQKLEAMIDEAAFRGAWVRFYLAMVLPEGDRERDALLEQAILDVRKFAEADDNESGVKFSALVLSGMCAREGGNWNQAKAYFRRVQDPSAPGEVRLMALFETVRVEIDRKNLTGATQQVETFKEAASKLPGIKPVAVDMRVALLLYKIDMVRAEAFAQADPAKYVEMRGEAGKHLVDFTDKYPDYRKPLAEIIAPLLADRDPSKIDPSMILLLADKEVGKETPEGDKRTEELLKALLNNPQAAAATKAGALWRLALLKNRQRLNLEAAEYFRELAEKHGSDPNARNAALNAVKSYEAILAEEQKKNPTRQVDALSMGARFGQGYVRALEVLVAGWGGSDPKINSYNYELGLLYDAMDRYSEAIAAFSKIPRTSELYLPSGFRIQQLRVRQLLDSPLANKAARQATAQALIRDLEQYMTRARQYLRATSDAARIAEVRQWGGECGLLVAQLYKEALDDAARAMAEARRTGDDPDWKLAPGIQRDCQRLVIGVLLERGRVEQKVIDDLAELVNTDDSAGTDYLLDRAIAQIAERIERLTYSRDPADKTTLQGLRTSYRLFAEKLQSSLSARGGLTEKQADALKQAVAQAYEFGTVEEVRKSLALYEELARTRPNDANIIRGMARAHRVLGEPRQAIELYDRLRHGLPEGSAAWWRMELERIQYAIDVYKDDEAGLKAIALHVKMLRRRKGADGLDGTLGGYEIQFGEVENAARHRLETLAVARPTPPGGGG
ncbi:MAG TPA: tetratricopeptide repeat protein [Phycisphaerae bacterium]|nr:tetratricopeptide repeat protein [Phycisphaerae bacterium]